MKFVVVPNAEGDEIEIEATEVKRDTKTGYLDFYNGESLVASILNASFYIKEVDTIEVDETPDPNEPASVPETERYTEEKP